MASVSGTWEVDRMPSDLWSRQFPHRVAFVLSSSLLLNVYILPT